LTARILFSLSALAASFLSGMQAPSSDLARDAAPRLARLAAPFAHSISEHASVEMPFAHTPAVLIAHPPLPQSVFLVASTVAIDHFERRHLRKFLRC
jgi:hypothetical protein